MRDLCITTLTLATLLASCQFSPPESKPRPSRLRPADLERIRVEPVEEEVEEVPVLGTPGEEAEAPRERLTLERLLMSVESHFPLIQAALIETELAAAEVQRTRGSFDTRLVTSGQWDAIDFYENERLDVALEQPTRLWGATVIGGYRLGTGDFADYDGKAKTDEGGEFRLGVKVPLLQGRTVDPRRIAEWQARLETQRAEPLILQKRIEATQKAAETYWKWIAAGLRVDIARQVLALAENRQEQLRVIVDEGLLPEISITDNQRVIVERRTKLIVSERKLQEQAIALSLFWRDEGNLPIVPLESDLPSDFPGIRAPEEIRIEDDLDRAIALRPEIQALQLNLSALELELEGAENDLLPSLDLGVFASQDIGPTVNDPDDKGDFEVTAGVLFDVPLQRSSARGKLRTIKAKIAKATRELQFSRDLVLSQVLDAVSALDQSWSGIEQASQNVDLSDQLAEAERIQVEAGESDLFRLNLREQQAALAADARIAILEEYFRAWARYRAALGVPYDEFQPLPDGYELEAQ